MQYLLISICLLPFLTAIISFFTKLSNSKVEKIAQISSIVSLLSIAVAIYQFTIIGNFHYGFLYFDILSVWCVMTVGVVYFLAAMLSPAFLDKEHKFANEQYTRRYFALLQIFVAVMFTILFLENFGLMWVAIEATTLISTLLVAFNYGRADLEAAWKYVMVCTVGICLALLGTIILYYAQINSIGTENALSYLWLKNHASNLDYKMVKLAFMFIFVGYATKLGLAPMHTWLPDAYSQSPAPISGLLSGGLSTCVLYVLIRNIALVRSVIGPVFVDNVLMTFGILSILVAVPFLVIQRDLKRLLAYSSVENMGMIIIGLAVNTPLAFLGTMLHILNHAVVKFSLFFITNKIIYQYKTKNIMRMHGLLTGVPATSRLFLLFIFAVLGLPPFGIFFSKFYIILSMFYKNYNWTAGFLLILLIGVFIGIFYHTIRMLSGKESKNIRPEYFCPTEKFVLGGVVLFLIISGISMPYFIKNFLGGMLNIAGVK